MYMYTRLIAELKSCMYSTMYQRNVNTMTNDSIEMYVNDMMKEDLLVMYKVLLQIYRRCLFIYAPHSPTRGEYWNQSCSSVHLMQVLRNSSREFVHIIHQHQVCFGDDACDFEIVILSVITNRFSYLSFSIAVLAMTTVFSCNIYH